MSAVGPGFVHRARTYLGTPFCAGGRTSHGLDCAGLLLRVAEDLGLERPVVPNYQLAFDSGCIAPYLQPFCERVPLALPPPLDPGDGGEPGDFLIFSLAKGVQHLGIATGDGTFVHAWDAPGIGRVTETPLNPWWQDRLLSVWRLKEGA
jgi:cell wall-associated NlpC family hydrolase